MKAKNYYELLEIKTTSNLDEIKKAFRSKIAIHHPDISKSKDAEKHFDNLVEAFDILSKPEKRKLYDTLLKDKNTVNSNKANLDIKKKEVVIKEWKKEAKEKSKKYKKMNQDNSLDLDIFSDALIEGLLDGLLDGAASIIEGTVEILGDILGDI